MNKSTLNLTTHTHSTTPHSPLERELSRSGDGSRGLEPPTRAALAMRLAMASSRSADWLPRRPTRAPAPAADALAAAAAADNPPPPFGVGDERVAAAALALDSGTWSIVWMEPPGECTVGGGTGLRPVTVTGRRGDGKSFTSDTSSRIMLRSAGYMPARRAHERARC
jgi:hypothetical protein